MKIASFFHMHVMRIIWAKKDGYWNYVHDTKLDLSMYILLSFYHNSWHFLNKWIMNVFAGGILVANSWEILR